MWVAPYEKSNLKKLPWKWMSKFLSFFFRLTTQQAVKIMKKWFIFSKELILDAKSSKERYFLCLRHKRLSVTQPQAIDTSIETYLSKSQAYRHRHCFDFCTFSNFDSHMLNVNLLYSVKKIIYLLWKNLNKFFFGPKLSIKCIFRIFGKEKLTTF